MTSWAKAPDASRQAPKSAAHGVIFMGCGRRLSLRSARNLAIVKREAGASGEAEEDAIGCEDFDRFTTERRKRAPFLRRIRAGLGAAGGIGADFRVCPICQVVFLEKCAAENSFFGGVVS